MNIVDLYVQNLTKDGVNNIALKNDIKLSNETIERIKAKFASDVSVFSLVTLNSDIKKITANLKAPVVINVNENLGEQVIIDKEKYKIKHPLVKEWYKC